MYQLLFFILHWVSFVYCEFIALSCPVLLCCNKVISLRGYGFYLSIYLPIYVHEYFPWNFESLFSGHLHTDQYKQCMNRMFSNPFETDLWLVEFTNIQCLQCYWMTGLLPNWCNAGLISSLIGASQAWAPPWLVHHRPGLLPDWCITGLFTYIRGAGYHWSPCWPVMTSLWPLTYIRDQYSCSICCTVLIAWLNELWVWAAVHMTECQDIAGTLCDQLQCRYYIFISNMFLINIRWCWEKLIWCVAGVWVFY